MSPVASSGEVPNQYASGWFADPYGRFEFRYFNGQRWTADVSVRGDRYIDQPPSEAVQPDAGAASRPRRGAAVASFILALCALAVGWAPFVFALAAVAAIVALVLGVIGLRNAKRQGGVGRGFAVTGLALAPLALGMCVLGFQLTRVVWREIDRYVEPGQYALTQDQPCAIDAGLATHRGTIQNLTDTTKSYTLVVELRQASDDSPTSKAITVTIDDVRAQSTAPWQAAGFVGGDAATCRVLRVQGPYPFDLEQP